MTNGHGVVARYTADKCRCPECREAYRAYRKQSRYREYDKRVLLPTLGGPRWVHPNTVHGRASSYTNYGCRCPECTDAQANRIQRYRERYRRER